MAADIIQEASISQNPHPSAPTWKEKYNSEPRASIHSPTLTSLTKQSCNYVELLIQTNRWIVPAPRTCHLFFHNIYFCSQMWEGTFSCPGVLKPMSQIFAIFSRVSWLVSSPVQRFSGPFTEWTTAEESVFFYDSSDVKRSSRRRRGPGLGIQSWWLLPEGKICAELKSAHQ